MTTRRLLRSLARPLQRRASIWPALIAALPLTVLTGCTSKDAPVLLEDGSAEVGVGALAIVDGQQIARVNLTITGPDMSPISVDLGYNNGQWHGSIGSIPTGSNRTFTATAYNADNVELYSGVTTGVEVLPGGPVAIMIVLQESTPDDPFSNSAPRILSVVAGDSVTLPEQTISLVVNATDADNDTLSYTWTATSGTLGNAGTANPTWTAPATGDQFTTLTVTVDDGHGAESAFSFQVYTTKSTSSVGIGSQFNNFPRVESIQAAGQVAEGGTVDVSLTVADADNDSLSIHWSDDCGGAFNSFHSTNPTWTAPSTAPISGTCELVATVQDGRGGSTTGSISIQIGQPPALNIPPVVSYTAQSTNHTAPGASVHFDVAATDPDDSSAASLTFVWSASDGGFGTPSNFAWNSSINWYAPATTGHQTITVEITDAGGASTTETFNVDVACVVDAECGVPTACATPTCNAGQCSVTYAANGTPTSSQTASDCQEVQCDGMGGTKSVAASDCAADYACTGVPAACTWIDNCSPNPCQNGGICTDGVNSFVCSCDQLHTGSLCESYNYCWNKTCGGHGTCVNGSSSATCICNSGYSYTASFGGTCLDINECATNNGGCSANATCTNIPGSRTCTCNAGYSGDGLTCTAVGNQPSCNNLTATCGPTQNESCCTSSTVTGGTFNRLNDSTYPATVSNFRMDRFEVTVGRFRKFFDAYPSSKPAAGAGAHPQIQGSGWNSAWDSYLPADQTALTNTLGRCNGTAFASLRTWTDQAGTHEQLPMNCVDWYTAFAFCAWDGGRLATFAESNYASAGGSEQRLYPWGSATPDSSHAVYGSSGIFSDILNVGSKSSIGDGKWGQADLGGSMADWTLDVLDLIPTTCTDCAVFSDSSNHDHLTTGGSWADPDAMMAVTTGDSKDAQYGYSGVGIRCVRNP